MKTRVFSAVTQGIKAHNIEVEIDITAPLRDHGAFKIIGLTSDIGPQVKQRVIMALKSCDIDLKKSNIFVNMAPASIKKVESSYDLPIAVAILQAMSIIKASQRFLDETIFTGELSIHGDIRPVTGALVLAYEAKSLNKKRLVVPTQNAQEAGLIEGVEVIGVDSIRSLIDHINKEHVIKPTKTNIDSIKKNHITS